MDAPGVEVNLTSTCLFVACRDGGSAVSGVEKPRNPFYLELSWRPRAVPAEENISMKRRPEPGIDLNTFEEVGIGGMSSHWKYTSQLGLTVH